VPQQAQAYQLQQPAQPGSQQQQSVGV
jgi:hypothetical protein